MADIDQFDSISSKAGYKLSRAAMREKYGSRRIDARAPQSAKEGTYSGRLRAFMASGMDDQAAQRADFERWRKTFDRTPPVEMPVVRGNAMLPGASPLSPNMPGLMARQRFQPRGLPTVQQPEMLASLPVSGSPLATPFQNDMDAVFGNIPLFRRPKTYMGLEAASALG